VLAAGSAGIFLELVGAVECRRIRGGGQARADAEPIDGHAISREHGKLIFIEPAAREDSHFSQATSVQDGAHATRVVGEITAIEANTTNGDTVGREAPRERNDASGGLLGIVGID